MTDRSRVSVAKGFGVAVAFIALTTLGVSGHALAASAKSGTPQPTAEATKLNFDANLASALPASRAHIDIDPIDPSVRHRWPDLSDSSSSDLMQHGKS